MELTYKYMYTGVALMLLGYKWCYDYASRRVSNYLKEKKDAKVKKYRLMSVVEGVSKMCLAAAGFQIFKKDAVAAHQVNTVTEDVIFVFIGFPLIVSGLLDFLSFHSDSTRMRQKSLISLAISFYTGGLLFFIYYIYNDSPVWQQYVCLYISVLFWFSCFIIISELIYPSLMILRCVSTLLFGNWFIFTSHIVAWVDSCHRKDDPKYLFPINASFGCYWVLLIILYIVFCVIMRDGDDDNGDDDVYDEEELVEEKEKTQNVEKISTESTYVTLGCIDPQCPYYKNETKLPHAEDLDFYCKSPLCLFEPRDADIDKALMYVAEALAEDNVGINPGDIIEVTVDDSEAPPEYSKVVHPDDIKNGNPDDVEAPPEYSVVVSPDAEEAPPEYSIVVDPEDAEEAQYK